MHLFLDSETTYTNLGAQEDPESSRVQNTDKMVHEEERQCPLLNWEGNMKRVIKGSS